MSGKLLAIVRREYLETVRTKGFVIGTILGPLLRSAMMFVPVMIARRGGEPLRVAVLDLAGGLRQPIRSRGNARVEVIHDHPLTGRIDHDGRYGRHAAREALQVSAIDPISLQLRLDYTGDCVVADARGEDSAPSQLRNGDRSGCSRPAADAAEARGHVLLAAVRQARDGEDEVLYGVPDAEDRCHGLGADQERVTA